MIISIALTPMITSAIGFKLTAIIYGILGGVVILYMSLTAKEVRIEEYDAKPALWSSLWIVQECEILAGWFYECLYSAAMSLVLVIAVFCQIHSGNLRQPADDLIRCCVDHCHRLCGGVGQTGAPIPAIPVWRISGMLALALSRCICQLAAHGNC